MNAHDPLAWLAPYLPQRRDPVEDESLQWADADDENEWQQQCEERAYQHMDAHDAKWLEWLIEPTIGPDGGDIARYISLSLHCTATGDHHGPEAIERAAIATNLRKGYIDYLVEND